MPGISLPPPGIEVIQEFVSAAPTAVAPFLPTVCVGAAIQIVDAFDDLGNPQANAFAGTYRDGQGVIAYDLPSLVAEGSTVGFEDDVRVFLVYGTVVDELNGVGDEELIIDDGTGDFTFATLKFVDATQLFEQIGVEPGDVVRVSYLDEVVDMVVATVDSDTELTLEASAVSEDLTGVSYDIVRNPAEFLFDSSQQANAEFGTEADYIRFSAQELKTDGITPGDYIGDAGDILTLILTDSERFLFGDDGVIGDSIFYSGTLATVTPGTAGFTASVGPAGPVADELILIGGSAEPAVLLDILEVVDDVQLVIESGNGAGLAQAWVVGDDALAAYTAASGTTVGAGAGTATLTVAGGDFLTSIPNSGPSTAPTVTTYVELSTGVYLVTQVNTNDVIEFTALSGATDALANQDPVFLLETENGADGDTGGLTNFLTPSGGLNGLADDSSEAINFGGTTAAALTSVSDDKNAIVGVGAPNPLVDGAAQAFSAVLLVQDLTLAFDPDTHQITVQVERGRDDPGMSASSFAEIADAINNNLNTSYNSLVTDVTDATLGGSPGGGATDVTEADLTTLQFDGGSDEEQLLLDADLLGSATPTASVYVSYKALQVGLSADAAEPQMWFIDNDTVRESILGPAVPDNPLSLAVSFALINSPSRGVWALGVGEVLAAKPNGTVAAFTRAFEFLEGEDVHTIVPATIDLSVAQILQAHVLAMSQPTEKRERIGFFNSPLPAYENAEVIASGTSGNTSAPFTGEVQAEFATSVDLALAGAADGDILVVTALSGADSELTAVNGTIGPLYGLPLASPFTKAGDDFVAIVDASGLTDTAWDSLVDVSWTLYRPGIAISQNVNQAEVIAETSEGFAERRMIHHWPDQGTADVDGTESLIDGHYIAASWGGRTNEAPPEQGFSRTSIAGWTGVKHSNGYFSNSQLNRIAGGGTFITVQDSQNAPLRCRHQLTTDTSSVVKRELSITRVIDYVAKFLRQGLDRQVGKFNITKSYLDGLSSAIQGLLRALEESGVIIKGELVSLTVNDLSPDRIDVVVAIDVPFPANYIEITLQI